MSITITKPKDDSELPILTEITFEGTADTDVSQVELWADDRWLLGKTPVSSGSWSIAYTFNTGGTRRIIAKGINTTNTKIAEEGIWLFLQDDNAIDLDMNLSANFKLFELTESVTARLSGIDNTPTRGEVENLRTLCNQLLQPARDVLGPLKINSGFRSEALNRKVDRRIAPIVLALLLILSLLAVRHES
ncbi:MAG: D-Ala-D-Ala carboxypeptidase family metallohydrolase [Oscillatoria sp. PMC 1068.18]|nr:D-Ala-D-Ala carboxypeptidase family metallohydrolase [Oscillatoria sp. PMC 1076.18]MEC4990493.1 D-Ala-D-Ala carboxypeptidase family metallohydrolase [Oscillatoria sp. PMC 1068.18]